VPLQLVTDHAELLAPFAALLARFRVDAPVRGARRLELRLDGGPRLVLGRRTFPLRGGADAVVAHGYSVLMHWALGQVRGHLLVHGAALARDGRGLVVAGRTGAGKTSVAAGLAARGWELLSDDVAALSLRDGRLHPFPKALSLRPGVAEPPRGTPAARLPVLDGSAKRLVDPAALGWRVARGPVPLRAFVLLEPDRPRGARTRPPVPLSVVVHRAPRGLPARVRALPGVHAVELWRGTRYPTLRIATDVPALVLPRVEVACAAAGALVIGAARATPRGRPDFAAAPRAEPLGLDEAVHAVLRNLWGVAHGRALAARGGGSALYLQVARRLASVRCWRVTPGRYGRELDLVEELGG